MTKVEAMSNSELRDRLETSIQQHRDEYVAIAKDIHAHPETGNNEYYASGQLTQLLENRVLPSRLTSPVMKPLLCGEGERQAWPDYRVPGGIRCAY